MINNQILIKIWYFDEFNLQVKMNCLNEAEILDNIIKRYEKKNIFTYIGPTLLVVNPYSKNIEYIE